MSAANESMPFKLREEDLTALAVCLRQHPPHRARSVASRALLVLLVIAWLGMTGLCVVNTKGRETEAAPALLLAGVIAANVLILSAVVLRHLWPRLLWGLAMQSPANRWLRGPLSLCVTPEGLSQSSPVSSTHYDWSVVRAIAESSDHVCFLITSHDGFVVPRRAFLSEEHFREFVALARRHREQATGAEPDRLRPGPGV
jgi:hypothetical protein